jgi:hypothetical protein
MPTDPTEYPPPLEPTQEAYSNPYEPTSPYPGGVPPIPPPPPKQSHKGLLIALISTVCLVLILGGVLIAVVAQHGQQPATVVRPTPRATVIPTQMPTPLPTPTEIPTSQPTIIVETPTPVPTPPMPYTATNIYQDFVNAGIQVGSAGPSIDWSNYRWYPSGGAVSWYDNAYGSTIEIAVFQSAQHVIDDASQLKVDGFSGQYVKGCVLFWQAADGMPSDLQAYINVMNTYCY